MATAIVAMRSLLGLLLIGTVSLVAPPDVAARPETIAGTVFVYDLVDEGGPRLVEVRIYPRWSGSRPGPETASRPTGEPIPAIVQPLGAASSRAGASGEAEPSELLAVLSRDPSPDVREEALAALAKLPGVPADVIAETALHDPAPSVRRKALQVLGLHPGAERPTIAAVLRSASSDPDEHVREAATELLESLVQD